LDLLSAAEWKGLDLLSAAESRLDPTLVDMSYMSMSLRKRGALNVRW